MKKSKAAGRSPAHKTRQIVLGFVNARREQMDEMFARALKTVEDGLNARHIVVKRRRGDRGAVIQDLGPDHNRRLESARLLLDILRAGRPLPDAPPPERPGFLLGELQRLSAAQEAEKKQGIAQRFPSVLEWRRARSVAQKDVRIAPTTASVESAPTGEVRTGGGEPERENEGEAGEGANDVGHYVG